jgi:hypothetical protein
MRKAATMLLGCSIKQIMAYRLRQAAGEILALVLFLAPSVASSTEPASAWPDATHLEDFLLQANVVERAKIGVGVTDSSKVTLELNGEEHQVIFKVFDRPYDSWRREVAAYELNKFLGLAMVPPTVERSVKGRRGCVQLWVEGEVLATASEDPDDLELWRRQVSTMWLFDYLTANTDRHLNNALITPDSRLVLIDNSRAFKTYTKVLKSLAEARGATRARFWIVEYDDQRQQYPTTYRDALIEKLGSMTQKDLKKTIGRYIDNNERKWLLDRRDRILQQIEELKSP